MYQQTDLLKSNIQGENSLYISDIQKGGCNSHIFRNILIENGYSKFNGIHIKGDLCYDSYYKDFRSENFLNYTIYCYCYDLKDLMDDPELFEFSFECQIESGRGIFGIEAIQWNFTNSNEAKKNLKFLEEKIEEIWKLMGSNKFSD